MMGACACLRTARESFLSYVCVADSHRSLSIDVVYLLISREGAPLAAVRCGALPPQCICTIQRCGWALGTLFAPEAHVFYFIILFFIHLSSRGLLWL